MTSEEKLAGNVIKRAGLKSKKIEKSMLVVE